MNTLWELAQSWEHDNTGTVFEPLHAPEICRRCQIEQWAREKAKEWNGIADDLHRMGSTRDDPTALWAQAHQRRQCIDDLGVPEDK